MSGRHQEIDWKTLSHEITYDKVYEHSYIETNGLR